MKLFTRITRAIALMTFVVFAFTLIFSANAFTGCTKAVDKADEDVPGIEMDEPPLGGESK